jgi:hypothetical protein
MKRYLASDVFYIRHLEALGNPQPLTSNKRALLMHYQKLERVKKSLPTAPAKAFLVWIFLLNISLGIVLGQTEGLAAYVGTVLMYFLLRLTEFHSLSGLPWSAAALSGALKRSRIDWAASQEQEPPIDGGHQHHSTGIELNEVSATRRTATGLLEEGRSGPGDGATVPGS